LNFSSFTESESSELSTGYFKICVILKLSSKTMNPLRIAVIILSRVTSHLSVKSLISSFVHFSSRIVLTVLFSFSSKFGSTRLLSSTPILSKNLFKNSTAVARSSVVCLVFIFRVLMCFYLKTTGLMCISILAVPFCVFFSILFTGRPMYELVSPLPSVTV